MRLLGIAIALAGCSFPTPSETFRCVENADCTGGRVCDEAAGFCVVSEDVDAAVVTPMDGSVDAPPDADPFIAIAQMCKDAGYLEEAAAGNGLYKRHMNQGEATTWINAENDCKDDVPGATHLIVLSTLDEVQFVRDASPGIDAWVGLNDIAAESNNDPAKFVTVTGEINDQRPFAGGEPNGGTGENCIALRESDDNLDDKPCNNGGVNARYICECDGKSPNI
jgi:hypothetical protein